MIRRRETAREGRDRRRAEAIERNARTPDDRRRASREGSPEYRQRPAPAAEPIALPAPAVAAEPRSTRSALRPPVRRPIVVPAQRPIVAAADPTVEDDDRSRDRRRAAYERRTARPTAPKTRPSDIAPRRIGDGIKPNHAARAILQTRPPLVIVAPKPVEESAP